MPNSAGSVHISSGIETSMTAAPRLPSANTFPGFTRYVIEQVRTRTLAFLNISAMGQIDHELGELLDIRWAMVERAVEIAMANRDTIVGIKVRLSQKLVGNNGVPPWSARCGLRTRLVVP